MADVAVVHLHFKGQLLPIAAATLAAILQMYFVDAASF